MVTSEKSNQRILALDFLRFCLAIHGVFFHGGITFNRYFARASQWPTFVSPGIPQLYDFLWISHQFRMQCFFVISGYLFSQSLTQEWRTLLLKKFVYIVLPLAILSLTLLPGHFFYFGKPPFFKSPDYLWFLWYLLLFMGLTKLIQTCATLLERIRSFLIPISLLALVGLFVGLQRPIPTPTDSWVPSGSAFFCYFIYFLVACLLGGRLQYLRRMNVVHWTGLVTLTAAGFLVFLGSRTYVSISPASRVVAALSPFSLCILLIAVLDRLFAYRTISPISANILKSYYPIFLFHKPIVVLFSATLTFGSIALHWRWIISSILASTVCILLSPSIWKLLNCIYRCTVSRSRSRVTH
jgi:hypothetical protein